MILEFLKIYYLGGLWRSFGVLLICRAYLTGMNTRALPSVVLGSIFWITGIVPLSALIHFHDIRLIAEKKYQKQKEITWKISDKQNISQ